MRHRKIAVIPVLIILSISVLPLSAQQNPFLSSPAAGNPAAETQKQPSSVTPAAPSYISRLYFDSGFMKTIRSLQKKTHRVISEILASYAGREQSGRLPLFLLFSYLYGLLHVIGPGHRKVFLFSYFISKPAQWKTGIAAGIITAVLHALSAVVLVGGLYLLASKALMSRFNDIVPITERLSYGLIAVIGVFLLIHSIKDLKSAGGNDETGSRHNPDTLLFVLASGFVPCPGAAAIMIFAMTAGIPAAGIWSVAAMSAGMATVLAFIPPLAVFTRNRLDRLNNGRTPAAAEALGFILSAAGAVFLILFGILFAI